MKNEFTNTKFYITINRRHIQIRGIGIEPIIWIQIQFGLTYCRLNILVNSSKMIYIQNLLFCTVCQFHIIAENVRS